MTIVSLVLATLVSGTVILVIKRKAELFGLVQHPNERSSHTGAVPTGGGLGIIAGSMASGVFVGQANTELIPILILALLIGVLGLLDDRWPLPSSLRLIVQFGAVGSLISSIGVVSFGSSELSNTVLILCAAAVVIGGVWWVNIFNFMDGIDGFAASEAACLLIGACALIVFTIEAPIFTDPVITLMLGVTGSTLCFLFVNWPPAKMFMGDAGSTFLGFTIFAIAILTMEYTWLSIWQWLILGGVFIVDATVTILVRLWRGFNIFQAHKHHGYQNLSRFWGSHKSVTLLLIAFNCTILIPLAWLAGTKEEYALEITTCVYSVLGLYALRVKAGTPPSR